MCSVGRCALEQKVLDVFNERGCELTESVLKDCFDDELERRWLRSVLTKLCVKDDLRRVKRYNWRKHTAEWIYTLNNKGKSI